MQVNKASVVKDAEAGPPANSQQKEGAVERTSNSFLRLIQHHYSVTPVPKSESQLRREEWLLPKIPFNRWFSMPAAVIIQFCCGSLYSWSVFNKPIDNLIHGENSNKALAPITFYIACGCFGLSCAIFGPWLERRGPMISCILGSSLFFLGNLLTALALYVRQIWLVFLGYGVIAGFGLGLCYICPVSALQKWFPDKRGFASGFAVCGFGAGSIAIAKVQIPLMNSVGLPLTFVILGSIYFVLMSLSALVLRTPPPNYNVGSDTRSVSKENCVLDEKNQKHHSMQQISSKNAEDIANGSSNKIPEDTPPLSLKNCLTSRDFRFMYLMFLANAVFGLVLISRLSNMVTDIFGRTPEEASTVVSINGGFNLGGRLVFSIVSDYVGRKSCYIVMLTSQLIIVAAFSTITATGTYWAFLFTMWILTSCYGAGFGVIPAFLTDRFGPHNIGACHGIILTAWSIAGVCGGLIFTTVFDAILATGYYTSKDAYPYYLNAWWIFVIILIGWMALLFVQPTRKDRELVLKMKRLFRSLCRCTTVRKKMVVSTP